jgi:hypothetical protein
MADKVNWQTRIGILFSTVLLAMLDGCQSARVARETPMPTPVVSGGASHFAGSPLSGPQNVSISPAAFNDALDVGVTWIALQNADPKSLDLVASQARLVTGSRGGAAVFASTGLTSDARVGWLKSDREGAAALSALGTGERVGLGDFRAALPVGATVAFTLIDSRSSGDDTLGSAGKREVEIDLYRAVAPVNGAESLQIGLAVQDFGKLGRGLGIASQPSDEPTMVFQRELAVVDHGFAKLPAGAIFLVPFRFVSGVNQWTAALISISRPGANDPSFARLLAQCRNDLAAAGEPVSAAASDAGAGLTKSVDLLGSPVRRRAALVYLADQTGATICQDVALVADDSLLKTLAGEVKSEAGPALVVGDVAAAGWAMDRSAISTMQPLLTSATLPEELFAVLTVHLGEPGRHSASLEEIMHGAASRQDLDQRLIAENFIYLEDSSPASRVRAFDWLQARHLAPAGFDPLAPAKQRRVALDKALSAPPATQSAGGGQ